MLSRIFNIGRGDILLFQLFMFCDMITGLPKKNGLLFYFVKGSQTVRSLWRGYIESGCTRFFLAESSKKCFVFASKHYFQYFSVLIY